MDRIPSDHPSIETVRARVERHGGGKRLAIPKTALPDADPIPRVILEGETRFASLGTGDDGWIVGIFDTTRAAEETGTGRDRLDPWLEANDRPIGSSVELDVIEPGERYGLRIPGERTVYKNVGQRDSGLDAIARAAEDRQRSSE